MKESTTFTYKILFITHVVEMAGANRSMLQLIIELRNYYNIYPVVLYPENRDSQISIVSKLKELDIESIAYDIRFFKTNSHLTHNEKCYYLKYLNSIKKDSSLLRKLNCYHFDLIHSNSSVIDIGGYISRILKIKHVWHLREFGDLDYNLHCILGNHYEQKTYQNGDAFIAISQHIKEHFSCLIDSCNIHLIYNGIYTNTPPKKSIVTHPTIQFVCAGLITESKNQLEIVKAVKYLVLRNIHDFHLTLVGLWTQPYITELQHYINKNNLINYVTILHEIDNIHSLLAHMDIGIMPSNAEAFGRVTVEYMLNKLAVIANDGGANTEIIEDGVSGIIYPKGDAKKLSYKMQNLINNRKFIIQLAENGYLKANEKFLSRQNSKQIFILYKRLLSTKDSYINNIIQYSNLSLSFFLSKEYLLLKIHATYTLFRHYIHIYKLKLLHVTNI